MVQKNKHIINELEQVSPKLIPAYIESSLMFTVPPNYFDNLHIAILNAISIKNLGQYSIPYQIPVGYFDNLYSSILNKIATHNNIINDVDSELQEIAPVLSTIIKTNIYTVPTGYFEVLQINNKFQKPLAKVVSLKNINTWIKYAVAACMIGVVVSSVYIFTNRKATVNYAAYSKIDVINSINAVSSDELVNYLDMINGYSNNEIVNIQDVNMPDTQEHIKNISDEDLMQYLNEVNLLVTDTKKDI